MSDVDPNGEWPWFDAEGNLLDPVTLNQVLAEFSATSSFAAAAREWGKTVQAAPYRSPVTDHEGEEVLIDEMIAYLEEVTPLEDSFREFVDSLAEKWRRTGRLSEKQQSAIERSYWRAKSNERRNRR